MLSNHLRFVSKQSLQVKLTLHGQRVRTKSGANNEQILTWFFLVVSALWKDCGSSTLEGHAKLLLHMIYTKVL